MYKVPIELGKKPICADYAEMGLPTRINENTNDQV